MLELKNPLAKSMLEEGEKEIAKAEPKKVPEPTTKKPVDQELENLRKANPSTQFERVDGTLWSKTPLVNGRKNGKDVVAGHTYTPVMMPHEKADNRKSYFIASDGSRHNSWSEYASKMRGSKAAQPSQQPKPSKPSVDPVAKAKDDFNKGKISLGEMDDVAIKEFEKKQNAQKPQFSDFTDDELLEELVDNKYFYENAKDENQIADWMAERLKISPDRARAFVKANYQNGQVWNEEAPSNDPAQKLMGVKSVRDAVIDDTLKGSKVNAKAVKALADREYEKPLQIPSDIKEQFNALGYNDDDIIKQFQYHKEDLIDPDDPEQVITNDDVFGYMRSHLADNIILPNRQSTPNQSRPEPRQIDADDERSWGPQNDYDEIADDVDRILRENNINIPYAVEITNGSAVDIGARDEKQLRQIRYALSNAGYELEDISGGNGYLGVRITEEKPRYTIGSNKLLTEPIERKKMELLVSDLQKAGLSNVKLEDGWEDYGARMEWTAPVSNGTWVLSTREWLDYMNGKITSADIINELKNGRYKDIWAWNKTNNEKDAIIENIYSKYSRTPRDVVARIAEEEGYDKDKIEERLVNDSSIPGSNNYKPQTSTFDELSKLNVGEMIDSENGQLLLIKKTPTALTFRDESGKTQVITNAKIPQNSNGEFPPKDRYLTDEELQKAIDDQFFKIDYSTAKYIYDMGKKYGMNPAQLYSDMIKLGHEDMKRQLIKEQAPSQEEIEEARKLREQRNKK